LSGFTCSVCGEYHAERLLDIRMGLPDPIFELGDADRARRAWVGDDSAVLDENRFFVRGLLQLPIPELENAFGYGVWAEVSGDDWLQLGKLWRDERQAEAPPFAGSLANELEPYERTLGLPLSLQLVSLERLPAVHLAEAPHSLVADQRHGITVERAEQLAATVQHR
jgi:hypothetical protein